MVKIATQINWERAEVYAVLSNFANYPKWFPGCEGMVIHSSADNTTVVDITLSGLKKTVMNLKYVCEPDVLIKFELVKPGDVNAYVGSYRLMNADSGTGVVLVQEVDLDAGAPKFIVDRMMKKSLEACGAALIKMAKERPASAPAGGGASAAPVAAKKKRARCLLRVVKTDSGEEQIWYGGKTFVSK